MQAKKGLFHEMYPPVHKMTFSVHEMKNSGYLKCTLLIEVQ
jgi:hypothetical protein